MKRQVFALLVATCLLSSDIPNVHASQEDITEQENSPIQESPSEQEIDDEQKDTTNQENSDVEEPPSEQEIDDEQKDTTNQENSDVEEPPSEQQIDDEQKDTTNQENSDVEEPPSEQEVDDEQEDTTEQENTDTEEPPNEQEVDDEQEDTTKQENTDTVEPPSEQEVDDEQEDTTEQENTDTVEPPSEQEVDDEQEDTTEQVTAPVQKVPVKQEVNNEQQETTEQEIATVQEMEEGEPQPLAVNQTISGNYTTSIQNEQEAYDRMTELKELEELGKKKYGEGITWDDKTHEYRWNGGGVGIGNKVTIGTGCAAFTFMISDELFASSPGTARQFSEGNIDFDKVYVGDILRINGNHSVIVYQVYDGAVMIAEGNNGHKVHWGRMLTKAEVEGATYHITRYPVDYRREPAADADENWDANAKGEVGNLNWRVTKAGKLIISGSGEIPDLNANEQPWKDYVDKILTVTIEDGVTSIGDNAFYNFDTSNGASISQIVNISIPSTVKSIGNSAFRGTSVVSVAIPPSVKSIGNDAFRACENLVSVNIANGVETIGERAFRGSQSLTSIELPSSITAVGGGAFFNCTGLISAVFISGNHAVTLGDDLFSGCHGLLYVTLPQNIESINKGMFTSCISLSVVNIPQGVKEIGEKAFASCTRLSQVTLPNTVTKIGLGAFSASGLTKITIPNSVNTIVGSAFSQSAVKDIYFGGTQERWNTISSSDASSLKNATVHCESQLYTLTVNNGSGNGTYLKDTIVMIAADPLPNGKVFINWTSDNPDVQFGDANNSYTTFVMPEGNVTITANYKEGNEYNGTDTPEEEYTLTVEGGTISGGTESGKYKAGQEVDIIANKAEEGKVFNQWTTSNGGTFADATNPNTTFTMPDGNVTVTATYRDSSISSTLYILTVNNGSGSGEYEAGEEITIEAEEAPAGKVFDKWTTDNTNVNFADATKASTTFTMPEGNVVITATYKTPEGQKPSTPQPPQVTQKIVLNKTSAILEVGETIDLEAEILPNSASQDIVWSIDNADLAELTVDSTKSSIAKITAKEKGTVIVTAKSKLYTGLSAICTIDIKENDTSNSDKDVLNDMITKISAISYSANGKKVNTRSELKNWIEDKIDDLKLADVTIESIDITEFTAAKSKQKGKFVFTVTLSKGEGKDKVTLTSSALNGTITQTGSSSSGGSSGGGGGSSSSSKKENTDKKDTSSVNTNNANTNNTEDSTNNDTNNEDDNNTNNTSDTTVNTSSKNVSVDKFVDVSSHWAIDNIKFVVEKGYFAGTSENSFSPDVPMTRAMVVSVLGRVANVQGNPNTKFVDVDPNQYYAPFIGWTLENGIASGMSETEFNPDMNVTREQLAVMFANFIKSQGYNLNTEKEVSFADSTEISPWAVESVEFMVKSGILNGRTDGSFDPKGVATRAEVATILKLFIEKTNK